MADRLQRHAIVVVGGGQTPPELIGNSGSRSALPSYGSKS